ncbi:hypothetical protein WK24_01340 [Burkholderia vietnamiensis]|nr:hypothetical protein WK24_01340 [Burkholderia vietnamiensis]
MLGDALINMVNDGGSVLCSARIGSFPCLFELLLEIYYLGIEFLKRFHLLCLLIESGLWRVSGVLYGFT